MPEYSPTIKPQPDAERYPVEALFLSERFTRATYQTKFGEQAPAYDPKRRIKRWFFSNLLEGVSDPDNELVSLQVWDEAKRTVRSMVFTVREAATPNLPGNVVYPKYTNPKETEAVLLDPSGSTSSMNGEKLIHPTLAAELVRSINRDLNVSYTIAPAAEPWPWRWAWQAEQRRALNVCAPNGECWDAAALAAQWLAKGIGAPGKWTLTDAGPVWVSAVGPEPEQDQRPEIPMPARALFPNERLECTPFGCSIVRTDLSQDKPGPGTGALTLEQDALLRTVAQEVAAIGDKLGL